jgi:Carboxypeptidase regulatory-like domain
MAGAKWNWVMPLVVAVLLFGTGSFVRAQSTLGGRLSGKLTDLNSAPLAGATVVLRNQLTGVEACTITARDGAYRFNALEPGEYTIDADSAQLGHGRLEGIQVSSGHESRVMAAMQFDRVAPVTVHSTFLENTRTVLTAGRATIATSSASLSADLPFEPLRELALAMYSAPASSREFLPTQTLLLTSTLEPVERLRFLLAKLPETDLPRIDAAHLPLPPAIQPQNPGRTLIPQPDQLGRQQSAIVTPAMTPVTSAPSVSAQISIAHRAAGYRHLATCVSAANGLRAAMQWKLPRENPVQGASQQNDPVSSAVATTISSSELQSLPATGRNWEEFAIDTPASAAEPGSTQVALRGAVQQDVDTSVDGASTKLAFGSASGSSPGSQAQSTSGQGMSESQGMAQVWSGGRYSVSEAAVRSMQTVAGNVEAEGAHASGGRINVETQRGSNGMHGQGFYFDRQNTWGARNPFTQWVQETAPATTIAVPVFTAQPYTPPDHEITWGFGAGSRIRRDKLFWFAALDSLRRNDPAISTVKWPGDFFAQPTNDQMQLLGAQLGTSTNAALAKYSQMLETLDGLLGPAPRVASQWGGFARLDWQAAERHRFALEEIGAHWDSPGGGLTRVSETYGNHSLGSSQASMQWLLARWEAFVTPNLLAVTQASAGHAIDSAHAETPSAFESTLNQNVWGQLPQIVVDSLYGFTIGNPSRFGQGSYPDEHLYRLQESVDWVRGNLLMKAGLDVGHNADSTSLLRNQTGTYYYANVENFVTDALVFGAFGFSDALDKFHQHNCDETGKVWRDSAGDLRGLGYLPCYSSYSQMMGPSSWYLSTNDWAGFATAQWQPGKLAVFSAGVRWEREQMPPPIAALANPGLPLAGKMPKLDLNWGPRMSLAIGESEGHWPVLRIGYGMYFGRTSNATLETVLTQTGSLKGDLNFFVRPTNNLNTGGAPPFPYVFAGEPLNLVKPGAVQFAPNFRNPEIHQAVAAIEETLPGHIELTVDALLSLGRRLPISIDTNFDPAVNPGTITYAVVDGTGKGPIKASQITVPFYALWPSATSGTGTVGRLDPNYQQIAEVFSRANSTYEALLFKISREGRRGLSLHAHYTYAHAMDWNPNESTVVAGNDVLDPSDFGREYGTSNLDVRHSAAATVIYTAPWKLHNLVGKAANGWLLSGIGQFRSGMPYTMRTSGSLPKEFNQLNGDVIAGLGPGMNGSAGDNRIYGVGNDKVLYNVGRNTYRYPSTRKADLRLAKQFDLGHLRDLQLLAESFNLFNHQNVTELETTGYYISSGSVSGSLPTLNFLTGLKANTTAFGQPLNINSTNYYRERQIQFGLRMRF